MLRRYVTRGQFLKEIAGEIASVVTILLVGGLVVMGLLTLIACIWAAARVDRTIHRDRMDDSRSGIENLPL